MNTNKTFKFYEGDSEFELYLTDDTLYVSVDFGRSTWDDPGKTTIHIPVERLEEFKENLKQFLETV